MLVGLDVARSWFAKISPRSLGSLMVPTLPKVFASAQIGSRMPATPTSTGKNMRSYLSFFLFCWYNTPCHLKEAKKLTHFFLLVLFSFWRGVFFDVDRSVKKVLVFNCTGPRDGDALLGPLAQVQSEVKFDEAVFTPAITFASNTYKGDLVNNNAALDLELNTQKTLAKCWVKQVDLAGRPEGEGETKTTVLPSIEHTVNWIDDFVQSERAQGADQIQVLVTGSLHLVGGVQSVLGCDVV